MLLRYSRNLYPPSGGDKVVMSIAWSPNSQKLGVLTADHSMYCFSDSGERQDKIGLRASEVKSTNKDFIPLCCAFSPCSTMIIVGQSDRVAYIFRIGQTWADKKSIFSRIPLDSAVTALAWASTASSSESSPILLGTAAGNLYTYSLDSKSLGSLVSCACFLGLQTAKSSLADNQATPLGPTSVPIKDIFFLGRHSFLIVLESGLAVLFDLSTQQLKVAARHSASITAASTISPKAAGGRHYLVLADIHGRLTAYTVETGAALCTINIKGTTAPFVGAASNPSGGSCVFANADGLYFLNFVNAQPPSIVYEPSASAQAIYQDSSTSFVPQPTYLAWRPDASILTLGNSLGSIDNFVLSVGSYRYCGAEVVASAPNVSLIKLPGFASTRFSQGAISLHASLSTEIRCIKAYPKETLAALVSNPKMVPHGLYLAGIADNSVVVYSFDKDTINEVPVSLAGHDKLFFDVDACRIMLVASPLGEFTLCHLLMHQAPQASYFKTDVYATVRGCIRPHSSTISCFPVYADGSDRVDRMLVAYLGEERTDVVVASLMPPDLCDDFSDPITILTRYRTSRAVDWLIFSPSGNALLIRDTSGGVSVMALADYGVATLSTAIGNGIVQWADPFDVVVGQESPDTPVHVWYNPCDVEDQPDLLQVPVSSDGEAWTLSHVESKPANLQKITPANLGNVSVQVVLQAKQGRRSGLPLDKNLLLFNLLLEKNDVLGACQLLTTIQETSKRPCNNNLWQKLCTIALNGFNFIVASRCYAALEDVPLSKAAREIHQRAQQVSDEGLGKDRVGLYYQAQIALLRSDLDTYEGLMMSCGRIDEVLSMYRDLRLYTRAERICPPSLIAQIQNEAIDWLVSSGQVTTAGMLLAQRGDVRGALELLIQDHSYLSAFELARRALSSGTSAPLGMLLETLTIKLEEARHYAQAAYLCVSGTNKEYTRALSLFRRAHHYNEAIELARQHLPQECLPIEREWAEYLFTSGQYEKAIPHYLEAMDQNMAIEAALRAGDYTTAESLLQTTPDASLCFRLAEVKYSAGDVNGAAQWLLKADQPLLAVTAYVCTGLFDDAVTFVRNNIPRQGQRDLFIQEARRIVALGDAVSSPTPADGASPIQSFLAKIEGMSHIKTAFQAVELLKTAGLYEDAAELLQSHGLWDDLYAFASENSAALSNYHDLIYAVANARLLRGDKRGAANILEELCMDLYRSAGSKAEVGASHVRLKTQSSHIFQMRQDVLLEAVQLYCELDMYMEATRLAKRCNDVNLLTDVFLMWLGASGNRLLIVQQMRQLSLLDAVIDKAADRGLWDICIELADHCVDPEEARSEIHWRHGRRLEAEGRIKEAEELYVKAGKLQEVIGMYIDRGMWDEARRLANSMSSSFERERALRTIREGHARLLVNEERYSEAEGEFVALNLVEEIVSIYKAKQMWQDALRVAREHGDAQMLMDISESYAQYDQLRSGTGGSTGSARVDMPVTPSVQPVGPTVASILDMGASGDVQKMIVNAARTGGDVLFEVVYSRCAEIAGLVLSRTVTEATVAPDMALLMSLVPQIQELGSTEERAMTLVMAYIMKGIPLTATTGVESRGTISLVMSEACKREYLLQISRALLSLEFTEDEYSTRICKAEVRGDGLYSQARTLLLNYRGMFLSTARGEEASKTDALNLIPGDAELSRCFEAIHLIIQLSKHNADTRSIPTARDIVMLSASLLRYCDLIPADRCFAIAGAACQQFATLSETNTNPKVVEARAQYLSQCYVFFNRLIDIYDAMADGSTTLEGVDATDFKGSGIPWNIPLPRTKYLSQARIESIKSLVLNLTMNDNSVAQELPREPCPFGCGRRVWIGACSCGECHKSSPICAITGFHVINPNTHVLPAHRACQICGCYARPAPWNNHIAKSKNCPLCQEVGFPMGK